MSLLTSEKKSRLQRHWNTLIEGVATSSLLNRLFAKEVITLAELEDIRAEGTRRKQVECLLPILLTKSDEAFQLFVNSLDESEQSHLAELIRHPVIASGSGLSTATSSSVTQPVAQSFSSTSSSVTQPVAQTSQTIISNGSIAVGVESVVDMNAKVTANYVTIVNEMDPRTGVLDGMISEYLIDMEEAAAIRGMSTKHDRARAVMKHLYGHYETNTTVFDKFVTILGQVDDYKALSERITRTLPATLPVISTQENDRLRGRVQTLYQQIKQQIDPRYQICDYLFMKGVINHQRMDPINLLPLRVDRAEAILSHLNTLASAHPTGYVALVEAIALEQPHLAQQIRTAAT